MSSVLAGYLKDKLLQKSTYILPAVVGTMINSYGQFLIPYLRGVERPFESFIVQLNNTPGLVILSIFVGYCFPFLVALYSAVMTRFGSRAIELKAQFPDNKPDPVFCAEEDGTIILFGNKTKEFIDKLGFQSAIELLGQDLWRNILSSVNGKTDIHFSPLFYSEESQKKYLVRYSKNPEKGINVYLTEIPDGF